MQNLATDCFQNKKGASKKKNHLQKKWRQTPEQEEEEEEVGLSFLSKRKKDC